ATPGQTRRPESSEITARYAQVPAAPTITHPTKFENGTPKYGPGGVYTKSGPRNHRSPRTARGSMTTSTALMSTPVAIAIPARGAARPASANRARKTGRTAKTDGRSVTGPARRAMREVSVIESACDHLGREGPAGRDRARPGAPARPTGSRRSLGRSARRQHDNYLRAAAPLPSH